MSLVREQNNLEILGRRLKEIRELRLMSPLKLAAEMESSLTSVRDWEEGARKLKPLTISRLAEVFQLSYPEEMYWHGLAGHLPKTRMPAKRQIIDALEGYYEDLVTLPFPAQIIDHQLTYWVVNPATIDFLGSRDQLINRMEDRLSALDVIFDSENGFFDRVSQYEDIESRQRQLTRRIVGRSLHRRHEPFYQNFPKLLQYRLSPRDFRQFLTIWNEANSVEQNEQPHLEDDIMLRYFEFQYPSRPLRKLQMRTDHLRHFGDIFEIILYYPFEPEDETLYRPVAHKGVKLWEIMNVDSLLRMYRDD
jgi:transcriptional regulator with XRE-family HTH domain